MGVRAEAFILAGGRSTRMGSDKALLRYQQTTLIELAVANLMSIGISPRIVGCRPDLAGFAPVVGDLRPGCGPLGGIEAALVASDTEFNVFIPVDLPLMPAFFLEWMVARAELTGAMATIPVLQGRPQPLCCVLRLGLLPRIRQTLDEGNFKVMPALSAGGETDLINVESVAPTQRDSLVEPPVHRWFQNVNFPEDWRALGAVDTCGD